MGFRELIKKVQQYSGFSDVESKDALELMVESLAVRLNEGGRKNFASQLPQELQNIALSVMSTEENTRPSLLQQFMTMGNIQESRAKKQILSAWQALKDAITPGEIAHIRAQLPRTTATFLQ
jgi:uncharacterized protein (DUF2267 family)